ncbi:MAG: bifunctional alpha,alpha-trehalose-phosphate synthase (UDP-forming)/trehalose-phosphatase, partial [Cyclobacterium sp.]
MSKTIIVSNRLPVSLQHKNGKFEFKPSAGGLATGLGSIYKEGENIWIGWPGNDVEDESQRLEITEELKKLKMA